MSTIGAAARRRSRFLHSVRASVCLAAAAMSGCSDATSPREEVKATFAATVSGGTTRVLTGTAIFDPDVPGFGMSLVQASGQSGENAVRHAIYFRRGIVGAPQPGDYTIVGASDTDTDISAGVVLDGDGDNPLLCGAISGTLRLSSVSTTYLRGTFTVKAECSHVVGDEPVPIDVAGSFVAEQGTIDMPDEPAAVAGATYVLSTVDGLPVPYLLRDSTDASGLRARKWLVADTIHFSADRELSLTRTYRSREEGPDMPAEEDDYSGSLGGYFRQAGDKIRIAWGFISVPTDPEYSDTLRLRSNGLVRMAPLPPGCLVCPVGPVVEYVYVRPTTKM